MSIYAAVIKNFLRTILLINKQERCGLLITIYSNYRYQGSYITSLGNGQDGDFLRMPRVSK